MPAVVVTTIKRAFWLSASSSLAQVGIWGVQNSLSSKPALLLDLFPRLRQHHKENKTTSTPSLACELASSVHALSWMPVKVGSRALLAVGDSLGTITIWSFKFPISSGFLFC